MNLVHTDLAVGYYYYQTLNPDPASEETCDSSVQHGRSEHDIPPWNLADTLGVIAMFTAPFAIAPLVFTGAGLFVPIAAGPIAAKGAAIATAKLVVSAKAASATKLLIHAGIGLVAGVSRAASNSRRR